MISKMHTSKGKICGIIVTFNPEEVFRRVLISAYAQLDEIIIVDNASNDESGPLIKKIFDETSDQSYEQEGQTKISVFFNSVNEGLSKAYNRALKKGETAQCDFYLFLDQDSLPNPGAVRHLKEEYNRLSSVTNVGALNCVNAEPIHTISDKMRDNYYAKMYRKGKLLSDGNTQEILLCLNSGLFINKDIFKKIGKFDESHFVDSIDHDFSFRLLSHNLKIFMVKNAVISHTLGSEGEIKIGGKTVKTRLHSPERSYYLVRDTIITIRKHFFKFPFLSLFLAVSLFRLFLKSFMLKDRKKRLRFMIDGLFGTR